MDRLEGYRLPRVQANPEAAPTHFKDYLPRQIEHCLRLTLERLQTGLRKDTATTLSNPEVAILAQAAEALYNIYTDVQ